MQGVFGCDISGTTTTRSLINLLFGSDDKLSLQKDTHAVFPECTHVLCTKHIRQNVVRNLRYKIGASEREIKSVISKIFDYPDTGLIITTEEKLYDATGARLMLEFGDTYPNIVNYFQKSLTKLKVNVFIGFNMGF